MSLDWDHQFCLGCDTQTDSTAYCSEACRLRDYMKTASLSSPSSPNSEASSPAPSGPSYEWSFNKPTTTSTKFYLSPAFDFSTPQTSRANSILSPSASQTSLCSMRSTSSAGLDSTQQSDKAARELRAYARSFESVRNQRRRSY